MKLLYLSLLSIIEIPQRSTEIIRTNLKLVDEFFDRYPNIFEKKPITCGPVAYHKLLIDMPVKDFCQLAVDKKGVMLLPSDIYGMVINILEWDTDIRVFLKVCKSISRWVIRRTNCDYFSIRFY